MKKSVMTVLLVMSMLMVFCAACGSSDAPVAEVSATMAPTATPAPTEEPAEETPEPTATVEPEETAEPDGDEEEEETSTSNSGGAAAATTNSGGGNSGGNANSAAQTNPTEAPDLKTTAQNMSGQSVSALYAAIGSPSGSDYTASCLVPNGEDGLLYYDGFTVSTVRYADGTELVVGVY